MIILTSLAVVALVGLVALYVYWPELKQKVDDAHAKAEAAIAKAETEVKDKVDNVLK